jgi:hypothetical protein
LRNIKEFDYNSLLRVSLFFSELSKYQGLEFFEKEKQYLEQIKVKVQEVNAKNFENAITIQNIKEISNSL